MSPPRLIIAAAQLIFRMSEPREATVIELPPPDEVTDKSSEPLEPGELIHIERRRRKKKT